MVCLAPRAPGGSVRPRPLSRRASRMFRSQSYVIGDNATEAEKRWGWVLPCGQLIYGAAIFAFALYGLQGERLLAALGVPEIMVAGARLRRCLLRLPRRRTW